LILLGTTLLGKIPAGAAPEGWIPPLLGKKLLILFGELERLTTVPAGYRLIGHLYLVLPDRTIPHSRHLQHGHEGRCFG